MSVHNILQSVDVNIRNMDCSPPRKRRKGPSQRWSLNKSDFELDEIFDYGVKRLGEENDIKLNGEDLPWDKNHPDFIDITCKQLSPESAEKQLSLIEATLTKETVQKIANGELKEMMPKSPKQESYNINYFDLLSDEIILHIFHWLPKYLLSNIALVCKRFYRLTQDESLWARMNVSNRYLSPGSLSLIISRQVIVLRLAQSEIADPPFSPDSVVSSPDFKSRLLYLDLSMATVSVQGLSFLLSKCQRLRKLSLEHVPVDNQVLRCIAKNVDLEVLNLAMVEGIMLDGLKYLLKNCRKLKEINLAWTYMNYACIEYICLNLPSSLDRLNFSGCRKLLTDKNILDLVSSCSNLRELDLSDCTALTGDSVHHICLLEELNFLALSRCYLIPYRCLMGLKKISSLVYLDVHGGYIDSDELKILQEGLGGHVHINKFKFSSVARPTVGPRRTSIWGMRVRD